MRSLLQSGPCLALKLLFSLPLAALLPAPQLAAATSQIVGLLTVPQIFGGEVCRPFRGADVPVYRSPQGPRMGLLRVTNPWRADSATSCEELAVVFQSASGTALPLPTREFEYERKAAIVIERRPGWYQILLSDDSSGWLRQQPDNSFLDLKALFAERPLTPHPAWDGALYPQPGATSTPNLLAGRSQLAVNMLDAREIAGVWWMLVSLPVPGPCGDVADLSPRTVWVRVHLPDGSPAFWFSSRGC